MTSDEYAKILLQTIERLLDKDFPTRKDFENVISQVNTFNLLRIKEGKTKFMPRLADTLKRAKTDL